MDAMHLVSTAAFVLLLVYSLSKKMSAAPVAPALFIFGDSLADVGNNNGLHSLAKANFPPYGVDFPNSLPTGRFSNGYIGVDYLAMQLGLPLIPKFMDLTTAGENLLQGVNFASGASGIEDFSGRAFGQLIPLREQVQNFLKVKREILNITGPDAGLHIIQSAVYVIMTGHNDWLNTYLLPYSVLPKLFTTERYQDILVGSLMSKVKRLYRAGARKIGVSGIGPIGCLPSQLGAYKSNGTCIENLNRIALDYNDDLKARILAFNEVYPDAKLLYVELFKPIMDAIQNPSINGFRIVNQACCGLGNYGGLLICNKGLLWCTNQNDYVFWDAFHPTSKMQKQIVNLIWNNGPPYCYPQKASAFFKV